MNKSESIKSLTVAMLAFQVKCSKIIKKAENPFFKSKYADLPSILDEIAAPLQECGLVLSQHPDGDGLTTLLIHAESGEWMESTSTMHPVKNDPQSIGSAITYQRRYSICAILGLNVDEDDDGNEASKPKPQAPTDDKPWMTDEQVTDAIAYINSGKGTIDNIKAKYKISREKMTKIQEGTKR